MTSNNIDIVEYLRRNAVFNHRDTYIAAANEIERLRKELDTRIAMAQTTDLLLDLNQHRRHAND